MEEYLKRSDPKTGPFRVLALPIFPDRLQSSIVGRIELNFRVRDGNGWTLALINTNYCNRTAATKRIVTSAHSLVKKKVVTRRRIELLFAA